MTGDDQETRSSPSRGAIQILRLTTPSSGIGGDHETENHRVGGEGFRRGHRGCYYCLANKQSDVITFYISAASWKALVSVAALKP